jgi:hypothetical protein
MEEGPLARDLDFGARRLSLNREQREDETAGENECSERSRAVIHIADAACHGRCKYQKGYIESTIKIRHI